MRVFIGGVAGNTGRLLAERLLGGGRVQRVTGLDDRPCYPPLPGLHFVRAAYEQREWWPHLADADAAVLLTPLRWPLARRDRRREAALVSEARAFVGAAMALGVPRLIVANSAALYGVQAASAALGEDAPPRGHTASAYARARARLADWLELDAAPRYPGVLTRLRVAPLVGAHHGEIVRHVRRLPLLVCGEEDRALALVHEDDALLAIEHAIWHDLPGLYNVAAGDGLALHELAALTGRGQTCIPAAWLMLRAWWGWRWRGWPTPPLWARALLQDGMLRTDRLAAAGWSPRHSARDALLAALDAARATG
ncbi:MAG: NAD-dependent epimerase/dehydratase family protein [Anaerolineae bacterium]|nr:NAD-dependent epimerase/dehydratase family protein [Anaerolineae bacterium]